MGSFEAKPKIYLKDSDFPKGIRRLDLCTAMVREIFFIDHPSLDEHSTEGKRAFATYRKKDVHGKIWIYYPSLQTAISCLDEASYFKLRTARNRDLITEKEQAAYRNGRVGIAGLSVGSVLLQALVVTGGPKYLKLADPDTIEVKNLNRIHARFIDVGKNKTLVAAEAVWSLDPFAEIEMWDRGITTSTLDRFAKRPRLDVFVDEMDNIELKFRARELCKKARIPVVMATDIDDGALIDVERFDREPNRPIFHGRVSHTLTGKKTDRADFAAAAKKIIDVKFFSPRQRTSIEAVGKTLPGIPQLGTAAMIGGAAAAYVVRMILTGEDMPSGRYFLSCNAIFRKPISD